MPIPPTQIQVQFEEFHRNNPEVYRLLVRFARQAKAAGRSHYGMASIFERIRWHQNVETVRDDKFKLNNNFRSRYARLVMEREPDLKDFFNIRRLRSDR